MQQVLRFSPHTRHLSFREQCSTISSLLSSSPLTPSFLNTQIPSILSYPSEAIHTAIPPSLQAQLSTLIQTHRKALTFDADCFAVKYTQLPISEVPLPSSSSPTLFEIALKSQDKSVLQQEVVSRLPALSTGELSLFLWLFPDLPAITRQFLALQTPLSSSEQFYYLSQAYRHMTVPGLTPSLLSTVYHQFESARGEIDTNFLAHSLQYFDVAYDREVRLRVFSKVANEVQGLSPKAMASFVRAVADTVGVMGLKMVLGELVEEWIMKVDLEGVDDGTMVDIVEGVKDAGIRMREEVRKCLSDTLISRLPSAPLPVKSRLLHLLSTSHLAPASYLSPLLATLRHDSARRPSAYIPALTAFIISNNYSHSDLLAAIPEATLSELATVAQAMQTYAISTPELQSAIGTRLLTLLTPATSLDSALTHCEILGKVSAEERTLKAASNKLASIVLQHPEWVTERHLVAFAHQFSYVSFHSGINDLVIDFIKKRQQAEVVSDRMSADVHLFYCEGGKFHQPQNSFLNNKSRTQVAVLLISLLRGRKLDLDMQEIVRQYVKALITHWPLLTVKHRSSLVLGASLRENFDVQLWNALARTVNRLECQDFRSGEAMKSLAVYKTAANNVRNLLRNVHGLKEWPVEICLGGEVLEKYTKQTFYA